MPQAWPRVQPARCACSPSIGANSSRRVAGESATMAAAQFVITRTRTPPRRLRNRRRRERPIETGIPALRRPPRAARRVGSRRGSETSPGCWPADPNRVRGRRRNCVSGKRSAFSTKKLGEPGLAVRQSPVFEHLGYLSAGCAAIVGFRNDWGACGRASRRSGNGHAEGRYRSERSNV